MAQLCRRIAALGGIDQIICLQQLSLIHIFMYMGLVAIGNFTQPSYELSYAFKLMRLMILTLTALFNLWGFIAGQVIMMLLIAFNHSVSGGSYLYPLIPFHWRALKGVLIRRTMNNANS